jgi:GNAT superfamily N-acetyltransferase
MVVRPVFLSALSIVKKVLSADFGCDRSDFENEGIFIHRYTKSEGSRRFRTPDKPFTLVTMGRGVVVSCSLARLGWADAHLSQLSRNDIFAAPAVSMINKYLKKDGQILSEPDLKNICTVEIFKPYVPGADIEVTFVKNAGELGLFGDKRFPCSLGMGDNQERPTKIAAVAKIGGEIVGAASASADSDIMWQIGVDTLPDYRNRGVAKATVSALTEYMLEIGIVPYFSTFESNNESRAVAGALGYKTAWIEVNSRAKQP